MGLIVPPSGGLECPAKAKIANQCQAKACTPTEYTVPKTYQSRTNRQEVAKEGEESMGTGAGANNAGARSCSVFGDQTNQDHSNKLAGTVAKCAGGAPLLARRLRTGLPRSAGAPLVTHTGSPFRSATPSRYGRTATRATRKPRFMSRPSGLHLPRLAERQRMDG